VSIGMLVFDNHNESEAGWNLVTAYLYGHSFGIAIELAASWEVIRQVDFGHGVLGIVTRLWHILREVP
jgi:hypothetical protein